MKKKLYNIKMLMLLCVALSSAVLLSCDDNDDEKSDSIELLSFGPSGVQHGEEIILIGNNLDKVTAVDLVGASVPQSSFIEQTSEIIRIVIPETTEEGQIKLQTPAGEIISRSILSFEVPVVVETMTAEARPGATITITGEFVNWIESVTFPDGLVVNEFVSKSLNEIVVEVPWEAKSGQLIFNTGGTEPLVLKSETDLIVTLPTVTDLAPNPVERGGELTITGVNLDLVKEVLFKGNITVGREDFVSASETQIVVIVPVEINKGPITLVAYSGVGSDSPMPLGLVGDLPPLAPLAYAFYIDAIENSWGNWGWGGAVDFGNNENVRDGEKSIKKIYDSSWDALRFGGGTVSTAGYTHLVFSIYGETGTQGLKLQMIINEQWGAPQYIHEITEGEWFEISLPLADLGSPAEIKDLLWQAQGWSGTVYVDHVGLR